MLNNKSIFLLLFSSLLIITTCKKDEREMMVTTGTVTDATYNTANVSGQIVDVGEGATQYGHYYSLTANETSTGLMTQLGNPLKIKDYTSQLTGLTAGTKYYIKAYISDGAKTVYGEEISFSTVSPELPILISTVVENATSTMLEMIYNLSLANIIPAASAFTVQVNSAARTVNSIAISGTKVQLTLSSPVILGDIVTVAYTKPLSNPLQTPSGGQAASITAQNVTNNVIAVIPVYISSSVENATSTILGMTYNLSLANIIPAASAFTVQVNSAARTVNSIAISGTKVQLTLSSPVIFGDIVTVAYTKPVSNPLQTPSGGQAASITAQNVTNNVTAVIPVYISSSVENATSTILEMIYNLSLANIIPTASAFTVQVNSAARTVNSIAISGTKVQLTLSSPVIFGDIVTVAYTKPVSNPLQTPSGGQAASISGQSVTNNCISSALPTIITIAINSIATTTANSGGNITSEGGSTVTARGVCWNTVIGPTTTNSKTIDGVGSGSFISNLTGLIANTTYYVRAYATNSAGTAYGDQVSFTTLASYTITTSDIINITSTRADGGGIITSNGEAGTITERGLCYGTSQYPSTSGSKVPVTGTTGVFTCNLTGLSSGTLYYVRAYAISSVGTFYGGQVSFATLASPPAVTTTAISSISSTSALSGGNVTSNGGASISERGICYSTLQNPTTSDNKITASGSIGIFTSSLTLLSTNTIYYIRAYAINSAGTSYGAQITFRTFNATGITDIDGNNYNSVTIDQQVWMAENLKTTTLNDGTPIPSVTDNTAWAALLTPGYCWYNNTGSNSVTYGALYNWYTVNSGKLCPIGWHVPTQSEITAMQTYLGDYTIVGGKMKETGTSHWSNPNIGATNETSFTALPGGERNGIYGTFNSLGSTGTWWTNTTASGTYGVMWYLQSSETRIIISPCCTSEKVDGYSVRCLKD